MSAKFYGVLSPFLYFCRQILELDMKKLIYSLFAFFAIGMAFQSCNDNETYADMKENEREAIEAYIKSEGIKVISLEQFHAQDSITDTLKNEYVLFKDKGVYMQIVRKGEGKPIADGERAELIARYYEVNIKEGDTLTGNIYDASNPDLLTIENKSGNYSGSFTSGYMTKYGSNVPSGWMAPMPYVNIGRKHPLAKVRLIVPHSEGQSNATSYVYPCFYEITYQKGR